MARLLEKVSLKKYNTFGVEAKAAYFFEFSEPDELISFINQKNESATMRDLPFYILSGGSNILLTGDYDGIIFYPQIKGQEIIKENDKYVWVKVGAGVVWDDFVSWAIENNYSGIENLSDIPGFVGTSPIQNIGAYGVEAKEVIYEVETVVIKGNNVGEKATFSNTACKFDYRNSVFKNEEKDKHLICNVTFRLNKIHKLRSSYENIAAELEKLGVSDPAMADIRQAILNIRAEKIPSPDIYGNAGSFFKNPVVDKDVADVIKESYPTLVTYDVSEFAVKIPAGWLIEQCGWKGRRFGDAGIHRKQALVILNYGKATGREILNMAKQVQYNVIEKFGINLEMEVNIV